MTRINLIPVIELSDQHLLAEYRELPRIVNAVINQKAILKNIPDSYRLGIGHVKFFYNKIGFLVERFRQIYAEMDYRGFKPNPKFSYDSMAEKISKCTYLAQIDYKFSQTEIEISRNRLIEKIKEKPQWYRWTKRCRPDYVD